MRTVIAMLGVTCLSMAIPIRVAAADEPKQQIHLKTHEIVRSIERLPKRHPLDPEVYLDRFINYLKQKELGLGPVLTLLPAEQADLADLDETAELDPPRFAFVARTGGRTLVSLTKIGSTADQEDRVLHQRWLISDLLAGQRYSLTVYKENTIDRDALRFLGVGARLMLRPNIEVAGWKFGFEMFGSYHPDHQATAYFALTGKSIGPSPHPLPGSAARAARRHGTAIPLRW